MFLKAPELRFRRKLAPTPGKFGIITFLQDPILHDGNQTSQTRDVCVNCRSVSGWRGAPRRRLTACRDRPHARASHACEEGSHCFTITSTGRRASSVRSLSTEQRQLLTAERRCTCARVPRGPAPRQRVRNARLSARREFKACEGARPGVSGGLWGTHRTRRPRASSRRRALARMTRRRSPRAPRTRSRRRTPTRATSAMPPLRAARRRARACRARGGRRLTVPLGTAQMARSKRALAASRRARRLERLARRDAASDAPARALRDWHAAGPLARWRRTRQLWR